ncbi:hypothetical protein DFJ73DRAFT_806600 [Zopfochytrium polystomum]|nr:hypothetical protein DFJ73DRAFT_806600 [Zopfochytrium polystomum]
MSNTGPGSSWTDGVAADQSYVTVGGPSANSSSSQGFANASLLALAPSVPIIRIPRNIYLTLLGGAIAANVPPTCCPSLSQYSQFFLLGSREVFNDKLVVQVKEIVPFPSNEVNMLNILASHMNSNGSTILGWAVSSRYLDVSSSLTSTLIDAAAAQIATSYFDLFHTAVLNVFARNSAVLKVDNSLSSLSKFCIDTCTFLQDCVGLVCLPRNVFSGSSIMIAFDSPQLMPYDIERRLAVLCPPLFAAIDPKLAAVENSASATGRPPSAGGPGKPPFETSGGNPSSPRLGQIRRPAASSPSIGMSVMSPIGLNALFNTPPSQPQLPTPSLHPPMPLPVPAAGVNKLPHSTLHILPAVQSGFLTSCFGQEALLRAQSDLDDAHIPAGFQLPHAAPGSGGGGGGGTTHGGSAAAAAGFGDGAGAEGAAGRARLRAQILGPLAQRVDQYDVKYRELEDLFRLAEALSKVTPEDFVK